MSSCPINCHHWNHVSCGFMDFMAIKHYVLEIQPVTHNCLVSKILHSLYGVLDLLLHKGTWKRLNVLPQLWNGETNQCSQGFCAVPVLSLTRRVPYANLLKRKPLFFNVFNSIYPCPYTIRLSVGTLAELQVHCFPWIKVMFEEKGFWVLRVIDFHGKIIDFSIWDITN